MIDSYIHAYQVDPTKLRLDLLRGTSDWIRWIPESKEECASLSCGDCRVYAIKCGFSVCSHGNCEYQDGLPDRHPQRRIQEWLV